MRRVERLSVFSLLLAALALAACVQSQTVLLTGMRPETPLPAAFVVANEEGKPEADRFDRVDETYVAVENGVKTTYRLYPLEDMVGADGPFFIAVETNERGAGANYGLVELAQGTMVLHGFDDAAIAAELGLEAGKFGIEVETDEQLLAVFRRVADDAQNGATRASRFKVLDLADPAQSAEAERALEATRKARQAGQ